MEKQEWKYEHKFGVISVEGWGNPFLVVTQDKYFDGEHYGYYYWKLGVSFEKFDEARAEVDKLNKEFDGTCAKRLSNDESMKFLALIQERFPEADEILAKVSTK